MVSPEENSIFLARIDERTKLLTEQVISLQHEVKELKVRIDTEFEKQNIKNSAQYITQDTFRPVQRAMFAAISTIVAAVVMAAINFIAKT